MSHPSCFRLPPGVHGISSNATITRLITLEITTEAASAILNCSFLAGTFIQQKSNNLLAPTAYNDLLRRLEAYRDYGYYHKE
jgi:hypothetical protein